MSDRQLIADLLSALEYHTEQTRPIQFSKVAIEAAQEYLRKPKQPEPEPVGYLYVTDPWGAPEYHFSVEKKEGYFNEPVYKHPLKREPEPEPVAWTDEMAKVPDHVWGKREPLTDEALKPLIQKAMMYYGHNPDHWTLTAGAGFYALARAIEAAHGIKGEA